MGHRQAGRDGSGRTVGRSGRDGSDGRSVGGRPGRASGFKQPPGGLWTCSGALDL